MVPSRACGARPCKGVSPCETALRGNAGNKMGGDFLGGARSARPRGEAVLKPRDNMITEGQTNGPWPNGAVPRWKGRVARGRAEPAPPRGGRSELRRPSGGGPGNEAEGGFLGDTVLSCQASLV
jgi:hypothetical protein